MFKNTVTPEMHYDDWAEQYDNDIAGWGYHAPDRVMKEATPFLKAHPGTPKILDVGIGTGLLSHKCRKVRSDIHVTGLDISAKMLELCAQRDVADSLHRLDVSKEALPFDDGTFDISMAAGLMENVENIGNAISEMARVTRPGGLIVFTYMPTTRHPMRERLAKKLRPGRTAEGQFVMGDLHLYRHNPEAIKTRALGEGVQTVELESFVGYRTYVVMTVRYDIFVGRKIKGLQ